MQKPRVIDVEFEVVAEGVKPPEPPKKRPWWKRYRLTFAKTTFLGMPLN